MYLVNDHGKRFPGSTVIINITVLDDEPTTRIISYIHGFIIPELQEGFRQKGSHVTKDYVSRLIREQSMYFEGDEDFNTKPKKILLEFLDEVRIYALENLQQFIYDSKLFR